MIVSAARVGLTAMALVAAVPAPAHKPQGSPGSPTELPPAAHSAAAVVDRFHDALRRGDTEAAQSLLAEDALIFEAGGAERGRAEYAAEHLAADAAFSKAVPAVVTRRAGRVDGTVAWIATEGRATGTYNGKPIDQSTTETMVVRNTKAGWKIVHIHWSSAAAPPRSTASAGTKSILSSSVPGAGSSVSQPTDLLLHFSPAARLLELTIEGPSGTIPMTVNAAGELTDYSVPLPDLERGPHTVSWRGTSRGQTYRGSFNFTVE